jgi:UDP-N-acetylmuramate dehydrogenase
MMANSRTADWVERLPPVRGRYVFDVDLSRTVWFRAGGRADVMFRPADIDDLAHFLAARPAGLPVTAVGLGSNLLVRDGGVEGVVVRLRQGFRDMTVRWDGARALVEVGAGALDMTIARRCRDQGIDGLSFLSGIPGTIGGALRMNAGAYGHEMADVVVEARALDGAGVMHAMAPDAMGLSYRHSAVPEDWIFVSALLAGRRGQPAEIARHMDEIAAEREASQPIRARTGGSTFTNPAGRAAWELVDEAGCRGLVRGGARISEQHCNFIVNEGDATASDIEGLGEEVRRRVEEKTGLSLDWEIRRIGRHGRWPQGSGEGEA